MGVIGYIRTSCKSHSGISSQLHKIKVACQCKNLSLDDCFIDNGVSGKNLLRPQLSMALNKLSESATTGMIVTRIDRLTRNSNDMQILLTHHFHNKELLSLTPSETGREKQVVVFAQWERESISERTKDALILKKARGEKTGGYVPFGYEQVDGKLIENQKEQEVISLIKKLREEGNSYRAIVEELNSNDIKTKNGKDWSITLVKRIIDRR